MARNDIHCPSKIIPTDYKFVGITTAPAARLDYLSAVRSRNARIAAHMQQTKGCYASHEHKGNCQVCGAHCHYMAVFHHEKTNEYIRTGMDCAEKMGMQDANEFRIFRDIVEAARHHAAGKRKAQGLLLQAGLTKAWDIYMSIHEVREMEQQFMNELHDPTTRLIFADWLDDQGQTARALMVRAGNYRSGRHIDTYPKPEREITYIVKGMVKYGNLRHYDRVKLTQLLAEIDLRDNGSPAVTTPEPQKPRDYEVRSTRLGVVKFTSNLSDGEAIASLSKMTNNEFAVSLSQQFRSSGLSAKQWAWVHYLATKEIAPAPVAAPAVVVAPSAPEVSDVAPF
jgi:uncharacterized protein (TIGR02996 family)